MEIGSAVILAERTGLGPVPVTVISGFLGAGKTTLLNHILSESHGIRAAVLVNDFGAINIDAKLVVGVEGETVNLANGCVCCSIRDDLIAACLGLLQRSEPPELLIIEISGVSDPVQAANTFLMPELQALLTLNSILTVVDAELFPALQNEAAVTARLQIQAADMVVLNKVDLVSGKQLTDVAASIRELVPGARILQATHGHVPLALVLDVDGRAALDEQSCETTAHKSYDAATRRHQHGEEFATWHWRCEQPLSLPGIRAVFEQLPRAVYRAKGIVFLEELLGYKVLLQMVGKRSVLTDIGHWKSEDPCSEIIVIGSPGGLNADALQRAFDGCIGSGNEAESPLLRLTRRIARRKAVFPSSKLS